ncbi:MAG: long-chain fatty acid--CoA ligase [Spirochaetes bacterium]|nr:long-chain fatty acid--CoA ligase [Spirochaetota bacterium]
MQRATREGYREFCATEKSVINMLLTRAKKRGNVAALSGFVEGKKYSYTWNDVTRIVYAIAHFLISSGMQKGDRVAIFSQNCPEWTLADLGIQAAGCIPVPIYATNSKDEAKYIIDDASIKVIFTGDQEQYDKANHIMDDTTLQMIISFQDSVIVNGTHSFYFNTIAKNIVSENGIKEIESRINDLSSDDILTIIYTSGTTGNPKGAVHTHGSFLAGIYASVFRFPEAGPGMVSLAFLPLSHVFERMWTYGVLLKGGENHYCRNPKEIMEILPLSKPNYMCSVPRLWEKMYATIFDRLQTAPPVKKKLFMWATYIGIHYDKQKRAKKWISPLLVLKHLVADILVLKKVRLLVGGNVRVFHVGGAAMSAEINEFFNGLGIPLAQGYGLTEFFPVAVGTATTAYPGVCGPILDIVEVRVSDEGEIQLRGPMCMKEYYNKPEATMEMFTQDGWFKTGDVGTIEEHDGKLYIRITDRIKDLIITAGGKNIAPQVIETMLGEDLYIEQVVVVGDGRKYISALIVPNFEMLDEYAKSKGIQYSTRQELITNPAIVEFYKNKIEKLTESLGQVEKIKKFTLMPQEFTQENGEITPTMKIRRKVIQQRYSQIIDKMYQD